MDLSIVQLIAVSAIPVILAITLHEAAHGYIAYRLGDPTAFLLGRVTANPTKHIDLVGTILVPGMILLASKAFGSSVLFGWAKPVPIVQRNLRQPRRDMGLVAAAGPIANILMALVWAFSFKLMVVAGATSEFLLTMAIIGIKVNLVLAVLNLMPIPPLDGGRILVSLLPPSIAASVSKLEPYGLFILLALIATGILGSIVLPLVGVGVSIIVSIFGL